MKDRQYLLICQLIGFLCIIIAIVLMAIFIQATLHEQKSFTDTGVLTEPSNYTFKLDGHIYFYDYYEVDTPITTFNNSCVEIKYNSGCGQTILYNIKCICQCECE